MKTHPQVSKYAHSEKHICERFLLNFKGYSCTKASTIPIRGLKFNQILVKGAKKIKFLRTLRRGDDSGHFASLLSRPAVHGPTLVTSEPIFTNFPIENVDFFDLFVQKKDERFIFWHPGLWTTLVGVKNAKIKPALEGRRPPLPFTSSRCGVEFRASATNRRQSVAVQHTEIAESEPMTLVVCSCYAAQYVATFSYSDSRSDDVVQLASVFGFCVLTIRFGRYTKSRRWRCDLVVERCR